MLNKAKLSNREKAFVEELKKETEKKD